MENDNQLLRDIAEELDDTVPNKVRTNNFWLRRILLGIQDLKEAIASGGGTVDLRDYIKKSNTTGLIKNDGSIDTSTYLTEHQSLTNYVEKSQTTGLLKNDGTVDTTTYLSSHQALSDLTDSNAHSNIGTSANATQSSINSAIDTAIGNVITIINGTGSND